MSSIKNRIRSCIKSYLRKYFNVGRTTDNIYIWMITDERSLHYRELSQSCPDILEYLEKVHPKKWYDDEYESLFFTIYEYILSKGIKVKIKETSDPEACMVQVGSINCYSMNRHKLITMIDSYSTYRNRIRTFT